MASAYGTVEEGDDYFLNLRLGGDVWNDATTHNKQVALYQATRKIDTLAFLGCKFLASQELEFPRLIYPNNPFVVPTVPQDIQYACFEIAIAYLDGRSSEEDQRSLRITSSAFASVRTTYDPTLADSAIQHGIPSYEAWALLQPYLLSGRDITLRRV